MVRNNIVPGINVIYNTDGVNGISANVIEQNRGVLVTDFSDPGFLVQNNTPASVRRVMAGPRAGHSFPCTVQ
jgi:hypothetical protein